MEESITGSSNYVNIKNKGYTSATPSYTTMKHMKGSVHTARLFKGSLICTISSNSVLIVLTLMVISLYVRLSANVSPAQNQIQGQGQTIEEKNSQIQDVIKNFSAYLQKQNEMLSNLTMLLESSTCSDIWKLNSHSASGEYILRTASGLWRNVYCNMTMTCGNTTAGWMRVAQLDINNCPPGMRKKNFYGTQTCVVSEDARGCTSVLYHSFGIPYSKVCGKVRGYTIGTLDGLHYRYDRWSVLDNYLMGLV